MGLVHVHGLAKTFTGAAGETVEVLRAVSFQIPSPAVVGVLGPNGVGKSVLLRLLAGLLPPDAGTVTLNGKPPTACPVGFVPASTPVFGWRRAIDDMAIGLEQRGIPRHARHAYVVEFLRHFSMDLPLSRRTYGFSAGQRQLTNIVRALAGPAPPDLVVLDEPWAALSPPVREDLLRCLDAVRQHPNVVVFLAAHSVRDALRVCDWILPLQERPVTIGPDDVIGIDLPRPRGRETATHPALEAVRTRLAAIYAALPHGLP